MTFDEVLAQVLELLQRQGRVSYRALKRRFALDDEYLEDLKAELIDAQRLAVDDAGRVLVWTRGVSATPAPPPTPPQPVPPPDTQAAHPPQRASPLVEARAPHAERRQLTVLFCDLADSTRLARQFDPEDLREVIRAYQATCVTVIQHFAGYVAQYLGDGLLVYFGYPQAHEDDAQRAVRTGLGILAAMGTLNARLVQDKGVRLAVRIGIHTGLVVVGEMGSGDRHEHLALGDTPNLAARLQGLADPDTVVISGASYRLAQGYFVCQDRGVQALKGLDTPVRVYQVVAESAAQSRLDAAAATGLTPLVGRESEVALLRDRWMQSSDGLGQVVLLSGEAGIGKSRLVRVLTERVVDVGTPRLTLRCSPYHTTSAFYPVIDHLQRLLQWHREAPPEARLATLEQALQAARLPLVEVVPLVATLLSLPVPERYPPLTLSPQRQKQKTQEALVAWLLAEAAQQPVLAVWEDLHWADPSTLELLGLLLDQVPTARLLLVLSYRPEFRPPWTPRSYVTPLALTRLTRHQIEEMVLRVTGGRPLPAAVVQQIVDKTDGIPLFVEELVKTILESGLVREEAGCYVLTGLLPPLAIPATLQAALMARLDRLAPVKEVAQLGAVLGREFAYEVLRAVAPMDAATLQHSVAQLVEAELLYQRGIPPQVVYVFKHALIRDAAYESMLKSTRQQVHQQIAQVLEAQFPETVETQPELLAHHYTAAGLYEQALAAWKRAGERALGRSAHREATVCFEQALSAVQQLPESRDTRAQAIDLRFALRTALMPSGAFGRIVAVLREAEALAVALDDPRRLRQVSIFMMQHFFITGDPDQAIAAGQHALATASGDVGLHVVAIAYLGMAYHTQGEYQQAMACCRRTVAALDDALRRERFGQVILPAVASRTFLAWGLAEVGQFAEGRAIGEEGCRIAEAVGHLGSLMFAYFGAGLPSLRQGDLPQALPRLERAVGLCQEVDLPLWFPWVAWALGLAYMLSRRVADALELLEQAVAQSASLGRWAYQALFVATLGEALLQAGHLAEARHRAEQALELARVHKERSHEAWALRLLGEIAAQCDPSDGEEAATYYRQALALADALGMRPLAAHCHCGLGSLYARTGRWDIARGELSAASELYRAMEMTFWLPQAQAAVAEVEGRGQ